MKPIPLSAGTLSLSIATTNANTLIANGSVTRSSGLVAGNLQKSVATGSNVAKPFEVGTGTSYTPATITFASSARDIRIRQRQTWPPLFVPGSLPDRPCRFDPSRCGVIRDGLRSSPRYWLCWRAPRP